MEWWIQPACRKISVAAFGTNFAGNQRRSPRGNRSARAGVRLYQFGYDSSGR